VGVHTGHGREGIYTREVGGYIHQGGTPRDIHQGSTPREVHHERYTMRGTPREVCHERYT